MLKLIAVASPTLLAATLAAGTAGGQVTAAQTTSPQVTVVGCVVRNGAVDVDKGTRVLNIAPGALALTAARISAGGRSNGVPGTPPQDHDSGTIPQRTIVGGRSGEPGTAAFELTGDHLTGLGDLVGRRVEVIGRLAAATPASGDRPRATTGTTRDATPVTGAGTREEHASEGPAHPSADLRQLDVVSFRGVAGACE